MAWPIPKNSVINPSPAGASLGPTESPAVVAIMVGIDQTVKPKTMAET